MLPVLNAASPQGAHNLKLSTYVHDHKVSDDVVGLYTPFNHEVTFVPAPVWTDIQAGRYERVPMPMFQDLVARKFLAEPGFDEGALDQVAIPSMPGFVSLWLLVVKTCNMGCKYCVVDAEEQTKQVAAEAKRTKGEALDLGAAVAEAAKAADYGRMTPQVAAAGIEMFQRSLERHAAPMAKTTIYGGEPLLNRPVLLHAIPRLREMTWRGQQQPIQILCFTNGLVYDEEIAALFKKYRVAVGMSIDGMEKQHDAARPRLDGSGTFRRTVESYNRYRDAGLDVGISCTIGKHNVGELSDIARYFVEELKAPSVQLQTPIQMPENRNPLYVNMREAADSAWAAFKTLRDHGVEEGLAMRRISRFISGQFHHRDCFAVGGELVVSYDGKLGPCHNATIGGEQYFKGTVFDTKFDPERQANFMEWHARMPINMPGCHGCPAIGLCGGGCPYNALLTKGSIWEKDPHQCGYMERFLDLLLEEVWSRYDTAVRQLAQPGVLPAAVPPAAGGPKFGLGH